MQPISLLLPTIHQQLTQWATVIPDFKLQDDVLVEHSPTFEGASIARCSEQINPSSRICLIIFKSCSLTTSFFTLSHAFPFQFTRTMSTKLRNSIWLISSFSVRANQSQRLAQRQEFPETGKENEERAGGNAQKTSKTKRQHPEATADKRRKAHVQLSKNGQETTEQHKHQLKSTLFNFGQRLRPRPAKSNPIRSKGIQCYIH